MQYLSKKKKKWASFYTGGGGATALASAFQSRVEADGGVVEAEQCLIDRIQNLKNLGLWDKASAVWLPHGYKESKLYAVKGGAGADFGFTRGGTRTRKATDYLESVAINVPALDYTNDTCPALSLEPARTNLLLRSEEFDNASWAKTRLTVTANATAAPDNLSTADALFETIDNLNHEVEQTISKAGSSLQYAFAIDVKPNGRNWVRVRFIDSGTNFVEKWIDVVNNTIGTTATGGTGFSLQSISRKVRPNGFYRIEAIITSSSTANMTIKIAPATGDNVINYAGNTSNGLYLWGVQLEQASYATSYIPTTSATVSRIAESVPALPPKGTNQILHSEAIDNAEWGKTNLTVTANDTNAPNNTLTADKLLETTTNGGHNFGQSVTKPASSLEYTFSISVKPIGRDWVLLSCNNAGGNATGKWFNITTGAVGNDYSAGSDFSLEKHSITSEANDFYRITITIKSDVATTVRGQVNVSNDGSTISYAGDVTKGFYAWGAQLEQGDEATTYVATTTVPVHNGTVIGQTEGTLYIKGRTKTDNIDKLLSLSDGTNNNRINIGFNSAKQVAGYVVSGGVTQALMTTAFVSDTDYKIAVIYQNNKAALFVNGVKITEDLTVVVPACTQIRFDTGNGTGPFYGFCESLIVLKTALTDAEAIAATQP